MDVGSFGQCSVMGRVRCSLGTWRGLSRTGRYSFLSTSSINVMVLPRDGYAAECEPIGWPPGGHAPRFDIL